MEDLSNENIIHVKKDGIQYLQFRRLLEYSDILNHAYSVGIDKNFRTARAVGKEPLSKEEYDNAIHNYQELCTSIGSNYNNIVRPNQAHTKNVKIINSKINCDKPDINVEAYNQVDGTITNKNNIVLATTNADCILLLFFDPVKKVIANVHSGWKGTLQRISTETVKKMQSEYGCKPQNIICCICPSIRKCHFTVHEDVKDPFYKEFKDLNNIDKIIVPVSNDTWSIDTVEINKTILKEMGLKEDNIVDCGICSVCKSNLIHSYRVEKESYGLSVALIELKNY